MQADGLANPLQLGLFTLVALVPWFSYLLYAKRFAVKD